MYGKIKFHFMSILFVLADEIDLLNVSFDGQHAPDRISAKAGLNELKRVAPSRRYVIASEFFLRSV